MSSLTISWEIATKFHFFRYMDRVLPFVMCLTTLKAVGVYRQLLSHIKAEIWVATGEAWRPQKVVLDFESSMLSALETELPETQRKGCYFHFCQALWRNLQRRGLQADYTRNDSLRKFFRKVMSIG